MFLNLSLAQFPLFENYESGQIELTLSLTHKIEVAIFN